VIAVLAADPLFAGGVDLGIVVVVLIKTVIAFAVPLVLTALMIWVERKVHGDMTNRIGPNRAGPWGILQTLADGAKLFTKEGMIPDKADRLVYRLAPYLSAVPAFLVFSIVPFGGNFNDGHDGTISILSNRTFLQLADPQPGVLILLVLSGIAVYGVMLAGWSSGSKYPLLGSVRATAQLVSYEAALGLSLVAVVLVTGSLSTHDMVVEQALPGAELGFLRTPNWNLIVTGVVPFVIFLIAATAEMSRPPFDFPEAEQELVAGFNTEYSSIRFALFYIAEFMATITFGGVIATLFLGGPAGPDLGLLPDWAWGSVWFFLKLAIFPFIWISFRATLPRLRYDQLMDLGWKVLIPLSLAWLLLVAALRIGDDEGWVPAIAVTAGSILAAAVLSVAVNVGRQRRELAEAAGREVFD
jgi:NADH-quinone oxidoreductase subunit H